MTASLEDKIASVKRQLDANPRMFAGNYRYFERRLRLIRLLGELERQKRVSEIHTGQKKRMDSKEAQKLSDQIIRYYLTMPDSPYVAAAAFSNDTTPLVVERFNEQTVSVEGELWLYRELTLQYRDGERLTAQELMDLTVQYLNLVEVSA